MVMFERIVVVDWSANSAPKTGKDSIWFADLSLATGAIRTANISTRAAAIDVLVELTTAPGRCLVGVDFSLGFPAGTAEALGLTGTPWAAMWELLASMIEDDDHNANNRFEIAAELNKRISPGPGPFWGCHPTKASDFLTTTKVACDPLPEWRTIESELRSRGKRPFSAWQLLGAGAVGSQSLLGIAAMSRFMQRSAASEQTVDVWPFTCGLAVPSADTVLVEVWPTLVDLPELAANVWESRVRDERQVVAVAQHLAEVDLVASFVPVVPPDSRATVLGEEGWVLGA
jgi:precorrin-8X/cobalt-precorrin-8 methylmutase